MVPLPVVYVKLTYITTPRDKSSKVFSLPINKLEVIKGSKKEPDKLPKAASPATRLNHRLPYTNHFHHVWPETVQFGAKKH